VRLGETELVALFRERHNFTPGQTVHLRPAPTSRTLFDQESGRRFDSLPSEIPPRPPSANADIRRRGG